MTRRCHAVAASAALLVALAVAGCDDSDSAASGTDDPAASPAATTDGETADPGDTGDTGDPGDTGADQPEGTADLPDVCTLLSEAEVSGFTGRQVDTVDEDGADPGDATRFCQWQGPDLRLAVFLTGTSAEVFAEESGYPGSTPVDGVGDAAYSNSGHLFVLDGAVQIDVYNTSAETDEENAAQAAEVAATLVDRVG